jgi:hypothetical protein
MPFNESKTTPYWFNPMTEMANAVGTSDPRYAWWFGVLGYTSTTQLTDLVALGNLSEPAYPAMDSTNIDALGLKEIFRVWMLHYLWTEITS